MIKVASTASPGLQKCILENFQYKFVLSRTGWPNLKFSWLFIINIQILAKVRWSVAMGISLNYFRVDTFINVAKVLKKLKCTKYWCKDILSSRISLVMCSSNQIRDWILHWDWFFVSGACVGSSFISFIWMKRNSNSKQNWLIFPPYSLAEYLTNLKFT